MLAVAAPLVVAATLALGAAEQARADGAAARDGRPTPEAVEVVFGETTDVSVEARVRPAGRSVELVTFRIALVSGESVPVEGGPIDWQRADRPVILDDLSPNHRYGFELQTSGTGPDGRKIVSPWMATRSVVTLARRPAAPDVRPVDQSMVLVAPSLAEGNPPWTTFAIVHEATGLWIAADGRLGPLPAWRTRADWLEHPVRGLDAGEVHAFQVVARSLADVRTVPGPVALVRTDDLVKRTSYYR